MPSDSADHAGKRLSVLLGRTASPQQTPHPPPAPAAASHQTTTATTQSARNSTASMGLSIYEPQSMRPYTPEPSDLPQQQREAEEELSGPPLPTTPQLPPPAHTANSTYPPQPPPIPHSDFPSSPTTYLPSNLTTPTLPCTSSTPSLAKPSFQSHRTASTTTTTDTTYLSRTHTSTDPFSPFYLHPTTRTSLEVDRAGIKNTFTPSASKSAINVHIHPVSTNASTSASDLEAGNPTAFNSNYEKTRRERWVPPLPRGGRDSSGVYGSHGAIEGRASSGNNVVAGGSKSCELLRLECAKKRQGRWRRLTARQRLGVKLLVGFFILGGVVGLVIGLWWRFTKLQGGVAG